MQNSQDTTVQLPYSQDEIQDAATLAVRLRAISKYNLVMTGILLSLGPEVRATIRNVLELARKEIDGPNEPRRTMGTKVFQCTRTHKRDFRITKH